MGGGEVLTEFTFTRGLDMARHMHFCGQPNGINGIALKQIAGKSQSAQINPKSHLPSLGTNDMSMDVSAALVHATLATMGGGRGHFHTKDYIMLKLSGCLFGEKLSLSRYVFLQNCFCQGYIFC